MLINLPCRPSTSLGGLDFLQSNIKVPPNSKRESLFMNEFLSGNVPDFLRNTVEIEISLDGNTLKYYVLPNFLCIGSDTDYVHIPLEPGTAKKIADSTGCMLPTPKMAYQIWQKSTVKLTPRPNGPPYTGIQQFTEKLIQNEMSIKKQMPHNAGGSLVSGHKKDVVICKRLLADPTKVAIYGWWFPDGKKIQPLNSVSHDRYYKDYSHGIRLVFQSAILNEQPCNLFEILSGPLASIISDEGSFDGKNIYL